MQSLNITSPSSPHTYLSLPLPIINDPPDKILSMNLNLEEHFDHLNLEKSHISPIPNLVIEPILKPIEPTPTPSPQPTITHPI